MHLSQAQISCVLKHKERIAYAPLWDATLKSLFVGYAHGETKGLKVYHCMGTSNGGNTSLVNKHQTNVYAFLLNRPKYSFYFHKINYCWNTDMYWI